MSAAVGGGGIGSIPTGSISKLKAQLRQTKRLLQRTDLTPDLKQTTQRREQALQLELDRTTKHAEVANLEKKMVTKYRGVRFFERQKLLRKIKQAKKSLVGAPDDEAFLQELRDARVDLYYVIHFPKTSKYQSLFPDGTYIPLDYSAPSTSTDLRTSFRKEILQKLVKGLISEDVEGGDLGIQGEEDVGTGPSSTSAEVVPLPTKTKRERKAEDEEGSKKKKAKTTALPPPTPPVEEPAVVEEEPADEVKAPLTGAAVTKKAKKDLKDQKRKEKKLAELAVANPPTAPPVEAVSAAPVVVTQSKRENKKNGKGRKGKGENLLQEDVPQELSKTSTAFERDDFFA